MEMCSKGAERKRRWQLKEEAHVGAAADFQSYGRPLEVVLLFKYLVGVLTASYDDLQALVFNLRKDRQKWSRMSRILDW